jgi:hypothetical protein
MAYVESYTVNEQSFDTPQFAMEEVSQNTPTMRGDNLRPAMDHGVRWREKRMGARTETWTIWVCDTNTTTGLPRASREANLADFNANWDTVMTILMTTHKAATYEAPLKVVRKMKTNGASPTNMYRVNYGEVGGEIQVADHSTFQYARFQVPILYMDPRWYESGSTGTKTAETLTTSANPGGSALMTRMTIALASATNPYIINNTTGSKLTYTGTGAVTFDTTDYTAFVGGTNVSGNVDRTGSTTSDWFQLQPGVSNSFSSNTSYTITYTKAFI